MPTRSQAHLLRTGRYTSGGVSPFPPAIGGVSPDSASIANASAVNTTVATLTATGGTPPFTFTIASNPDALAVAISGNLLRSTVNPIGALGLHNFSVTATDARGQTKTDTLPITLT